MRKLTFLLLLWVLLPGPGAAAQEELPAADGAAILKYILETAPYTRWGTFPADGIGDFHGIYLKGGEPHGATVRIYVNDIGLAGALTEDFGGALPPGTMVVKENYPGPPDDRGALADLTIMYKVAGFNPGANDWYWVKASGDGSEISAAGALEGCIDCHGQEGNVDYLLRYGFGAEPFISLGPVLPGPDGVQVMAYLLEQDPYTGWQAWPGLEGYITTNSTHGQEVIVYANAIARRAAALTGFDPAETGALPAGSIIVEEGYARNMGNPKLMTITAMYKVEGFNPHAGDWFWVAADPTGKVNAAGALNGCIECHGAEGHQDYTRLGLGAAGE
ncbi:MAG: cytochrome P460 family protein [Anaerolineae bacterium]|nr:cytochrome P460 family protein [Anaerolineae bacterium]